MAVNAIQLLNWRNAKALAIANPNSDPETCIAMQEMYIELKQLRRDNLKLLNREDLFTALVRYFIHSRLNHYLTPELEELVSEIQDLAEDANISLEDFDG